MNVIKSGGFCIVETEKEFILVLNDSIHGPFPATKEMYDAMYCLLKDPFDKSAVTDIRKARKKVV